MIEALEAYERALDQLFSVPRTLADGTPISGPSPEERVLMAEFISDSVRQRGQPAFLGCYEVSDDANPYVIFLLCLRPLIAAMAAEKGHSVIFAATSSAMKAKAELNFMSLSVLAPIQFVDWGDLAELARTPNPALSKVFIIGDVDFEPGNTRQQLSSSDGIVAHEETLRWINSQIRNKHSDLILFHRKGWSGALGLSGLKNIERKSGCFIATACCGSGEHPDVHVLRRFRDEKLAHHALGRWLIRVYERLSPPLADLIRPRPWARDLVRGSLVRPIGRWASRRLNSNRS